MHFLKKKNKLKKMNRINDENEIKIAFLQKQIQLTEQRLQNIFKDNKLVTSTPFGIFSMKFINNSYLI